MKVRHVGRPVPDHDRVVAVSMQDEGSVVEVARGKARSAGLLMAEQGRGVEGEEKVRE